MENLELPADNCPTPPARQVTVYTRVLHRACQIVGGVEQLAARLRVPVDIVLPASADDELLANALRAARPKKPD